MIKNKENKKNKNTIALREAKILIKCFGVSECNRVKLKIIY